MATGAKNAKSQMTTVRIPHDVMEDIELSKRLIKLGRPACLKARVTTSGRRWETDGLCKTVILMWKLRLLYFLGSSPNRLAKLYRDTRDGRK